MAVSLPFWASEACTLFQGKPTGMSGDCGPPVGLNKPFWMSELVGKSVAFDMAASAPGAPWNGGGPTSYPGTHASKFSISAAVIATRTYRSNRFGGAYSFNRDLGVRGFNVSDDDCRALGLEPSQIKMTGANLYWEYRGYVDHYMEAGLYQFRVTSPFTGRRAYTSYTYGDNGRQYAVRGWNSGPPGPNDIMLPFIRSTAGDHSPYFRVKTR